jgi:hypothetical protein
MIAAVVCMCLLNLRIVAIYLFVTCGFAIFVDIFHLMHRDSFILDC